LQRFHVRGLAKMKKEQLVARVRQLQLSPVQLLDAITCKDVLLSCNSAHSHSTCPCFFFAFLFFSFLSFFLSFLFIYYLFLAHVPLLPATFKHLRAYLLLSHRAVWAFLDPDLDPLERLHYAWYASYFVEGWTADCQAKRILAEECLTTNQRDCIHLNARSLLLYLWWLVSQPALRDTIPFAPHVLSEQPCEQLYRSTRASGGSDPNFTLPELLRRLSWAQMSEVIRVRRQADFRWPKHRKHSSMESLNRSGKILNDGSVTEASLLHTLWAARGEAERDLLALGITIIVPPAASATAATSTSTSTATLTAAISTTIPAVVAAAPTATATTSEEDDADDTALDVLHLNFVDADPDDEDDDDDDLAPEADVLLPEYEEESDSDGAEGQPSDGAEGQPSDGADVALPSSPPAAFNSEFAPRAARVARQSSSPFIVDKSGARYHKQTACAFASRHSKLSSDRLLRFREANVQ
jgi:hypothetical protein